MRITGDFPGKGAYPGVAEGSYAGGAVPVHSLPMSSTITPDPVRSRCWWTVTRRTSSVSGSSWRISGVAEHPVAVMDGIFSVPPCESVINGETGTRDVD